MLKCKWESQRIFNSSSSSFKNQSLQQQLNKIQIYILFYAKHAATTETIPTAVT